MLVVSLIFARSDYNQQDWFHFGMSMFGAGMMGMCLLIDILDIVDDIISILKRN